MKVDAIRDEYLLVCKCKNYHCIMALFDNNRISVNGICMIHPILRECPRCKEKYRKVRDCDPEFSDLMKMRRYGFTLRPAFSDN